LKQERSEQPSEIETTKKDKIKSLTSCSYDEDENEIRQTVLPLIDSFSSDFPLPAARSISESLSCSDDPL